MVQENTTKILASSPPDNPKDWKSPFILINGNLLSIEEYLKNPKEFNQAPIPKPYLVTVCQSFSKSFIRNFNVILPKELTED